MKGNLIILLCTVLFLLSVKQRDAAARIITGPHSTIDTVPGDSPHLSTDNEGRPVLSWVRQTGRREAVLCYAVSENGGKSFGKTVVIQPSSNIYSHAENLAKVIFKPTGEIIAVWGARNPNPESIYSGLIFYAQSFDNGETWTTARPLVTDTAGYDQRYSDVTLLPDGEVGIMWLDNRKTTEKEGSAVFFAKTSGHAGFGDGKLISEPSCQCCRTSLFADSKGNIHAIYRGIINDSIRDMVHIVSEDGGATFTPARIVHDDNWVLRGCPHTGPDMTENSSGMHFVWFTGARSSGSYYSASSDNGKTFVNHQNITEQGTHPQIVTTSADQLATVWDETHETPDGYYKRIGMQLRSAEGRELTKRFITPDSIYATYPVVVPCGRQKAVVAFTLRQNNRNYVAYTQISIR